MSEMKCPVCNSYLHKIPVKKAWVCSIHDSKDDLYGSKELWQELIRTRKALDIANEKLKHCVNITVEELDELKGNLLIAQDALLHFSKDPIANNALKKITALEQKE